MDTPEYTNNLITELHRAGMSAGLETFIGCVTIDLTENGSLMIDDGVGFLPREDHEVQIWHHVDGDATEVFLSEVPVPVEEVVKAAAKYIEEN